MFAHPVESTKDSVTYYCYTSKHTTDSELTYPVTQALSTSADQFQGRAVSIVEG